MQLDASAKTCNSNADSSGKLKPYNLGISIDGNSCKVAFQSFHQCFKSGGISIDGNSCKVAFQSFH